MMYMVILNSLEMLVGQADKADEVIEEIQTQIEAVQEKTAKLVEKKQAYFEISPAPDIWTAAAGTFQHEILTASRC